MRFVIEERLRGLHLNREEIIEWLCDNEALTLDIIKKVHGRLMYDISLSLKDDVENQAIDLVKEDLANEFSKVKSLPIETLYDKILDIELKNYIKKVGLNGQGY